MKRTLLLTVVSLTLLGLTSLRAQSADEPTTDTDEFHYRDGAYGYRAEAQLMDSLAVLEMMGEMPPAQVRQEQEKFRKAKKVKQKQKKEKMRKRKKQKKDKKKKKKKKS